MKSFNVCFLLIVKGTKELKVIREEIAISKNRKTIGNNEGRFTVKKMHVTNKLKRLSEIRIGNRAVIVSFENNDIYLKLMEMGCIPGEEIKVDHTAPMGGPIAIQVAGYNLSLRIDEAESIWVNEI